MPDDRDDLDDDLLALSARARTLVATLADRATDPTPLDRVRRRLDAVLSPCLGAAGPASPSPAATGGSVGGTGGGTADGDAPDGVDDEALLDAGSAAVGALLAAGVPWDDLHPLLLDLALAGQSHSDPHPVAAGHATTALNGPGVLPVEHFLLYEVARTHLHALAASTPATSLLDYGDVLQRVDDLHDPMARMAALPTPTASRAVQHAAARAAIAGLDRYGLDPRRVADAVARLDALWAADPDHRCASHGARSLPEPGDPTNPAGDLHLGGVS